MESDSGKQIAGERIAATEGPIASSHILLAEYRMLGNSILISELVGRVFFSGIILFSAFSKLEKSGLLVVILVMMVYAVFWLATMYIAYFRQRFVSKLIAEESYINSPQWGSLHIRSHYSQFDSQLARAKMIIAAAEPFIWVLVAVGAVSIMRA